MHEDALVSAAFRLEVVSNGKTALITGRRRAGLELGSLFAHDGPSDRRARRLDHLKRSRPAGGRTRRRARIISEDLADPLAPRRIYEELQIRRVEVGSGHSAGSA